MKYTPIREKDSEIAIVFAVILAVILAVALLALSLKVSDMIEDAVGISSGWAWTGLLGMACLVGFLAAD